MTYSTKTWSNTPPRCYHVHQILCHWTLTDSKHTEDKRQQTEAKPCHALSTSQMTILPLMPLATSIIWLVLCSAVNWAGCIQSLDFHSTAAPEVIRSSIVTWLVWCWKYISTCSTCCVLYPRYCSRLLEHHWFPYTTSPSQSSVVESELQSEMVPRGDVDFCLKNHADNRHFPFKHKCS